ncbi:MAG: glycosyl hydrolase 108 family protein [Nitrospiraceae bacterium]
MDSQLRGEVHRVYGFSFTEALALTMQFEGGWSNHSSDRGGRTKFGVTHVTLGEYNRRRGLLAYKPLVLVDLTPRQAADVYYLLYWLQYRIDTLPQAVQGLMFDWSVHSGGFAVRSMQRHFKLKPDGIVGPNTRAAVEGAIRRLGWGEVQRALAIRRMKHLCRLVRRDRSQGDFIVGWFDRVSNWLE